MKTIIRIIIVIFILLGVLWVGGSNWDDFKRGMKMKDPEDVYAPIVEKIPDMDNPSDVITDPGSPDLGGDGTDFTSDDGLDTLDYEKEKEGIVDEDISTTDGTIEKDTSEDEITKQEIGNNDKESTDLTETTEEITKKDVKKSKINLDLDTILSINKKSIDFSKATTLEILDFIAINYNTGVSISYIHKKPTTEESSEAIAINTEKEQIITNAGFTAEQIYNSQLESQEALDCLISTINVVEELPEKTDYDRTKFEKPVQTYTLNGETINRNDYAWKTSTYFNEEDFTYMCPYTGTILKDADDKKEDNDFSTLDYDHIVPLKSAYLRGADSWTEEQKNAYAYDQWVGVDVLNSANRSKSDKGPAEWLPDVNIGDYCYSWLLICSKYGLSMTEEEIQICKENIEIELENGNSVLHMGGQKQENVN